MNNRSDKSGSVGSLLARVHLIRAAAPLPRRPNPTAKAIALTPCPSFTQALSAEQELGSATLRLNCAATGDARAGQGAFAFAAAASEVPHTKVCTASTCLGVRPGTVMRLSGSIFFGLRIHLRAKA